MLKQLFYYLSTAFFFIVSLYLIFWIWWLIFPLILILILIVLFRFYQAKKMWNTLLKESINHSHKYHRSTKIEDDNVIDVEYEEVDLNG